MNKRIKNKINKRIMDKLQSKKEVLTQFEYDYLLKCGPKDLNSLKTNLKIKNGIFFLEGTKIINGEIVSLYADNVIVHQFMNLIDAMESVDSIDSLRYSLENHEANHTFFNSDETGSILSAGHGKMPKEEPETYFKHIAELDNLQLDTDSIDNLDKNILGTKERITTGVLNAETFDVSNIHLVTPESHREIKTTVKGLTYSSTAFSTEEQLKSAVNSIVKEPSKWNKLKGKLKGWFGK
ncbi:hypothetical protein LHA31_10240 [Carnobacterium viridans]|uniref:Uncharacterized protein n=1 Tax=Carnobacterium viridans TaxID=174587 RepID=A0A1H0YVL2_9LACT|nr:hypothetical protein [Carnobacterium viridans]UDE94924.1 hypothetical protein LHA31_10240 [Carnobacterium viridans]SDQ19174.1 hypothetical protein SAMN04487752_1178 [Carnobacterium viridans]